MGLKNKYLLPTRGCKNYLEEIDKDTYKLIPELDYVRVIYQDNNKDIFAIDPPDGPFMSVDDFEFNGTKVNGFEFNGKKLKEIKQNNGFILIFE